MTKKFVNLLKVSTYEHFDGFYILRREDTGQEILRREIDFMERINLELPILENQIDKYSINIDKKCIPDGANALIFLEQKVEDDLSVRSMHYAKIINLFDDGIRSLVNRKVFG